MMAWSTAGRAREEGDEDESEGSPLRCLSPARAAEPRPPCASTSSTIHPTRTDAMLAWQPLRTLARVASRPSLPSTWSLLSPPRLFSSSAPQLLVRKPTKYKLKTHQGAAKRWKALANGEFKRVRLPLPHPPPGLANSPPADHRAPPPSSTRPRQGASTSTATAACRASASTASASPPLRGQRGRGPSGGCSPTHEGAPLEVGCAGRLRTVVRYAGFSSLRSRVERPVRRNEIGRKERKAMR